VSACSDATGEQNHIAPNRNTCANGNARDSGRQRAPRRRRSREFHRDWGVVRKEDGSGLVSRQGAMHDELRDWRPRCTGTSKSPASGSCQRIARPTVIALTAHSEWGIAQISVRSSSSLLRSGRQPQRLLRLSPFRVRVPRRRARSHTIGLWPASRRFAVAKCWRRRNAE
jgi:hypothetical protein